MSGHILVVNATGKVGQEIVKQLPEAGARFKAASSRPSEARSVLGDGVPVVALDYERPETFAPALDNVDRVFIVYPYAYDTPEHLERICAFLDESVRRGVQQIVYLSALSIEKHPEDPMFLLEDHVAGCGVRHTILRPTWFMQNFNTLYLESLRQDSELRIPAAGHRISFIDTRDIAAVAVRALTGTQHDGRTYELTGGEALTHHEVVERISEVAGRPISYVSPSREEAIGQMLGDGVSERHVRFYSWLYEDIHLGRTAVVTRDVRQVLGREPIRFSRYVRDHAGAWRS